MMDEWMMRWMDVRELAPKITISILSQFLTCHTVGAKDTLKYKGLEKSIQYYTLLLRYIIYTMWTVWPNT